MTLRVLKYSSVTLSTSRSTLVSLSDLEGIHVLFSDSEGLLETSVSFRGTLSDSKGLQWHFSYFEGLYIFMVLG